MDGYRDMSMTGPLANQWWTVDLQSQCTILQVVLYTVYTVGGEILLLKL